MRKECDIYMSLEARETFLNRVRHKLNDYCIAVQVEKILESVSDCLYGFDLDVTQTNSVIIGDDFLEVYINALKVQGRSEKTLERYEYIIRRFMNSAKTNTKEISIHHVRTFLANEKERGICDNTLEGYRQIFSAFFGWLYKEGLISKNPIVNLGAIKVPKKLRKPYSETDIELMKQKAKYTRDAAIVTFLLATACRISEVTQLNRTDVNFTNRECKVLGKGNKERKVYLDEVACLFLQEYLNERTDANEALFVSIHAPYERIHPGGIRNMLKNLGINAEIDHVHPHKFRRTKATSLIKHGMPIHEVAAILGHDKLDTTMKYIAIDDNVIKNDYQKYG